MSKNDYEVLASQIGGIGGEEKQPGGATVIPNPARMPDSHMEETPNEGLGKLEHRSSYGGKETLTQEEEESKNAFLNRERKQLEANTIAEDDDPLVSEGWVPLKRKSFGIRGLFYPEDWEFYIRPATTQAIKNWISVDEKNALQLNEVFDEIIKLCVRIKSSTGTISWTHVNSWDRFWLILKVREVTFVSNKKSVSFEDNCAECDQEITFTLTPDSLHYEFPDEDIVDKHWNASDMAWHIDLSEYGVDEPEVVLHTPTLAVQKAIISYAQYVSNRGKKVDEQFVSNYLPWLLYKPSRDDAQLERQIQKIEKEFKNWSIPKHELMTDIIHNITVNPKETLKTICPHCGEEVISTVQFPNGIKVLFTVETGVQKFGSR